MARGATIMVNTTIMDLRRDATNASRFMLPPGFAMSMTTMARQTGVERDFVERRLRGHSIAPQCAPRRQHRRGTRIGGGRARSTTCPDISRQSLSANLMCAHPARSGAWSDEKPSPHATHRQIEEQRYRRIDERADNVRGRQLPADGALHHWPL